MRIRFLELLRLKNYLPQLTPFLNFAKKLLLFLSVNHTPNKNMLKVNKKTLAQCIKYAQC